MTNFWRRPTLRGVMSFATMSHPIYHQRAFEAERLNETMTDIKALADRIDPDRGYYTYTLTDDQRRTIAAILDHLDAPGQGPIYSMREMARRLREVGCDEEALWLDELADLIER